MKKRASAKKQAKRDPERATEVPVTQAMLYEVRHELKSDIRALDRKMDSGFKKVDARFSDVYSVLHSMDSRIHHIALMVEEQNAKNNIVLDRLTNLFDRQERLEVGVETRFAEQNQYLADFARWLKEEKNV